MRGGVGGVASMMNEAIFNQKVSMLLFIPAYATIMELSIMVIGNQGPTLQPLLSRGKIDCNYC